MSDPLGLDQNDSNVLVRALNYLGSPVTIATPGGAGFQAGGAPSLPSLPSAGGGGVAAASAAPGVGAPSTFRAATAGGGSAGGGAIPTELKDLGKTSLEALYNELFAPGMFEGGTGTPGMASEMGTRGNYIDLGGGVSPADAAQIEAALAAAREAGTMSVGGPTLYNMLMQGRDPARALGNTLTYSSLLPSTASGAASASAATGMSAEGIAALSPYIGAAGAFAGPVLAGLLSSYVFNDPYGRTRESEGSDLGLFAPGAMEGIMGARNPGEVQAALDWLGTNLGPNFLQSGIYGHLQPSQTQPVANQVNQMATVQRELLARAAAGDPEAKALLQQLGSQAGEGAFSRLERSGAPLGYSPGSEGGNVWDPRVTSSPYTALDASWITLELTRFRGHPIVGAERKVHDAEEPPAVPAGVSAAHR